jgi:hypothetical protein
MHHVALPLWAVSSRLRSCAAAVEAAVVAAVVTAGGAAVAVADEVLRACGRRSQRRAKARACFGMGGVVVAWYLPWLLCSKEFQKHTRQ